MFKQDVLILVNKKNRDALGLILVYAYLRFVHKLRVKIESTLFIPYFWVDFYRPAVVVYVSADCQLAISFYEYLHRMGCKKLMYFTETVVARYTESFFIGKYEYKSKIDAVLLPSSGMKEFLIRNGKIDEGQAHVVGNPVFDWCVAPFNSYFMHREEFSEKYKLPRGQKWILLATSFDFADLDMANYEKEYAHFSEPKEAIAGYQQQYRMLRDRIIDCVTETLKKHPDWHLLVKCHPNESRVVYDQAWKDNPQVTHVHGQEIYELIANTDALIHYASTTSIQAWGFGKPTVYLDPCRTEGLIGDDYQTFRGANYVCRNSAELETALADCLSGKKPPEEQLKNRKEFIDKWCSGLDGKAAKRFSDVVNAFARQPRTGHARRALSLRERLGSFRLLCRIYFILCVTRINKSIDLSKRYVSANLDLNELNEFLLIRSLRREVSPFLKTLLKH